MDNIEDLYNCYFTDNNINYSIDMIRLKTYIDYNTFAEIEFRFKTCWQDYVKKFWSSGRMVNFFYNYDIEVGEGQSFYFGFLHNTEKRRENESVKYNFTIEFNPNKLKDNKVLKYLLSISGEWYIKSYDLALDLKVSILDVIYDSAVKRRKDVKIDLHGYDDKTINIGKGDGRVKIYNKKKERGLNISSELTRIEVSRVLEDYPIDRIGFYRYEDVFPNIYLNNYLYTFSDYKDKTMLAILYAVQSGFPVSELSKTYKHKLKNMLEGGHKIRFSDKTANQVLRKTIFYYFMHNELVHWK